MSRQTLQKLWRKRLDDCAGSGRTVVDWCHYNKIGVHQFYYWKRRLASQSPPPAPHPTLIPLGILDPPPTPPLPAETASLTLRIAGVAIQVNHGFDPLLLRAVVDALSTPPC